MNNNHGHNWTKQRLRMIRIDGTTVYHHGCVKCGRDFAKEPDGDWRAVYVGIFRLELLAQEITDRWMAERCPEQRLEADMRIGPHVQGFEGAYTMKLPPQRRHF